MRASLRFCMITSFYPPYNFGGDGIFVRRLSNELARRGHSVEVIHCIDTYRLGAPLPQHRYADHPNVKVHGLKSRLGLLSPLATHQTGLPLLKSRRIQSILNKGFDVIHYHNISLVGGPGVLALGKAIKLYTMHDYWLVCPTHGLFRFNRTPCARPSLCLACTLVYKRPPQWWRYFGLMESSLRHIDAFIAPSLTSQRKHEQLGFTGRIVHLPNFVSMDETHYTNAVPAQDHNGTSRYFLFVGRLERLKGLHTLIPAFQRHSEAELWIAGTGSEESSLRESAGGNPNIRFLGQQSSERLEGLYRNAVAVIYPSANFQVGLPQSSVSSGHGAPLVIMEAFSQKTPVIASHLGRIPALLEQTGGGLVYSSEQELLETMARLLDDSAYRSDFGLRGYEAYCRNWTPAVHLQAYLALIEEIAGKKEPRQ
jgi:glycosyltransferase involved in cell wall biosynthesis